MKTKLLSVGILLLGISIFIQGGPGKPTVQDALFNDPTNHFTGDIGVDGMLHANGAVTSGLGVGAYYPIPGWFSPFAGVSLVQSNGPPIWKTMRGIVGDVDNFIASGIIEAGQIEGNTNVTQTTIFGSFGLNDNTMITVYTANRDAWGNVNDAQIMFEVPGGPTINLISTGGHGKSGLFMPGASISTQGFSGPAIRQFPDNASALAGGLSVGDFYRTGADPDVLCIVH